jgi:hypothetical protein
MIDKPVVVGELSRSMLVDTILVAAAGGPVLAVQYS